MGGDGRGQPGLERDGSIRVGPGDPGQVLEGAQIGQVGVDEVRRRARVGGGDELGGEVGFSSVVAGVARVAPCPVEPIEGLSSGIGHLPRGQQKRPKKSVDH